MTRKQWTWVGVGAGIVAIVAIAIVLLAGGSDDSQPEVQTAPLTGLPDPNGVANGRLRSR